MGYSLNLGGWNKVFAVPSCVVEKYIKIAGGNNIKVLLYYLNNAGKNLSCDEISAATGVKLEDCEDALMFWSETGLLKLTDDEIYPDTDAKITAEKATKITDDLPKKREELDLSLKKIKLERSPEFYPKDIVASIHESAELDFLFIHCEKLYGRPLRQTERNMLMLLVEEIGMPVDCAVMLIDYCHTIDKATPAYIKSIASDWVERDIMTVGKVEEEIRRLAVYKERETELKKLFEINGAFSKNQKNMIKKWSAEYGYDVEMIEEAYQRTLDGAAKLSFPYMDKILETWHSKGIKTKEKLLESENRQKTEKAAKKETSFDIDEITRASMQKYS